MLVRTYLGGMFGIRDPAMLQTLISFGPGKIVYSLDAKKTEGEGYLSPHQSPLFSPFFLPSS
jgi:hypothetical protein